MQGGRKGIQLFLLLPRTIHKVLDILLVVLVGAALEDCSFSQVEVDENRCTDTVLWMQTHLDIGEVSG